LPYSKTKTILVSEIDSSNEAALSNLMDLERETERERMIEK
jgi:hypothetical protein